jgi:hypothetical protein
VHTIICIAETAEAMHQLISFRLVSNTFGFLDNGSWSGHLLDISLKPKVWALHSRATDVPRALVELRSEIPS